MRPIFGRRIRRKLVATKKTTKASATKTPRRAVIIAGVRTPFMKAFGKFLKMDTIDLSVAATKALLDKTNLPRREIESIVWGGVILPTLAPNVGREVVLDLKMPWVEGTTMTRACASGLQAITTACAAIERGDMDVAIAGGSDSTSNAEVALPRKLMHAVAPVVMGGKATPADYLGMLAQMHPISEILPKQPKIAERTTGQVMGEAGEEMAQRNGISREAQDEFAVRSHHRAAAAIASGRFDREVIPVQTPDGQWVHTDGLVRGDTSVEKLAKLRPVFARNGTLTAGNSSPLTDGASAVLVMSEEKAKALGYEPLAVFRSWKYVAVDPADQLLMGPAIAMPIALERAGLTLKDMDFVDIHEAFAGQVLSVVKMCGSDAFAKARLGQDKAMGDINPDIMNVHGGSVSIGHPFGATGARMLTTMVNELQISGKQFALLGICAAGALAAGAVLERV